MHFEEFQRLSLSQSTQSLRENVLWIGKGPIQSKAAGPILLVRELGQNCGLVAFSPCGL
jgi:hypothetical protein